MSQVCIFGTASDRRGLQLGLQQLGSSSSSSGSGTLLPATPPPGHTQESMGLADLPSSSSPSSTNGIHSSSGVSGAASGGGSGDSGNSSISASGSSSGGGFLSRLAGSSSSDSARGPTILGALTGLNPHALSVGAAHCAAVVSQGKDVFGWGACDKGQLGRGELEGQGVPRVIISLRHKRVCQIACGAQHTLALTADGEVLAFGSNWRGQLGIGQPHVRSTIDPVKVQTPWKVSGRADDDITFVAAGALVSAAISRKGVLYLWGDHAQGQLGEGRKQEIAHSPIPQERGPFGEVDPQGGSSTQCAYVCFGEAHTLALTTTGRVVAFGDNSAGQCGVDEAQLLFGDADRVNSTDILDSVEPNKAKKRGFMASITHGDPLLELGTFPTEVRALRSKVIVSVAAGARHSLCVSSDGNVYSFGEGEHGQLGGGSITKSSGSMVPGNITSTFPLQRTTSGEEDKIIAVAAGRRHSLALSHLGHLYSWGQGDKYALGHTGDRKPCMTPRWVESLRGVFVNSVAASGDLTACLISPRVDSVPFSLPREPTSFLQNLNLVRESLPFPSIRVDTLSLFVGTYNINANPSALSVSSLTDWLLEDTPGVDASGLPRTGVIPDIYSIGFQELVGLDLRSVGKDQLEIEGSQMKVLAETNIEGTINRKVDGKQVSYVQIFSKQLVGAMLCVYVRRELAPLVQNVSGKETRVGVMGKAGNKGGVAVRFDIADSQFCFVTSHLAAGLSKVEKRNADYRTIASSLYFATTVSRSSFLNLREEPGDAPGRFKLSAAATSFEPTTIGTRQLTVFDHENIFWFGDFNYRIDGISKGEVIQLVQQGQLEQLARHDQLLREKEGDRAFIGFREGKISGFAPTYKYDLYSTTYDTSEKDRAPAWCDRVLWRGNARQLSYRRCDLLSSDHRPVRGLFQVDVQAVTHVASDPGPDLVDQRSSPKPPVKGPRDAHLQAAARRSVQLRGDSSKLLGMDLPRAQTPGAVLFQAANSSSKSEKAAISVGFAKFDYQATNDNELNLKQGDRLEILRKDDTGWWKVRKVGDQRQGWVSSEFIQEDLVAFTPAQPSMAPHPISVFVDSPLVEREDAENDSTGGRQGSAVSLEPPGRERVTVGISSVLTVGTVKQGWLSKQGHFRKNWKTRFFVLDSSKLAYYESQSVGDMSDQQALGSVDMKKAGLTVRTEASMDKKTGVVKHLFRLDFPGAKKPELIMEAASRQEMLDWSEALQSVILLAKSESSSNRHSANV